MLVLALDASTPVVAVGLGRFEGGERRLLAEVSVSSAGASETLLGAAEAVLNLAGEDLSGVEQILVGVGPGTFTGIRIACATARALAFGNSCSLSVNSTLAALAAPALGTRSVVLAVLDAKRGEVFARLYCGGRAGQISCAAPEEVAGGLPATPPGDLPLVVGDGAVRYREEMGGAGEIPPDESPLHRVTAAGHLLSASLEPVGAGEVVPVYVREPDAEVRRDLNPWSRR